MRLGRVEVKGDIGRQTMEAKVGCLQSGVIGG